ncbi:MAG: alpha/beta hydrolase family protein [Homoserinimonas sp.]|nr:alpha/beta hydrolase family protein [Homoserinimonas sp.]MCW5944798.1 hypothetical protein [Cryobacterium sp.]
MLAISVSAGGGAPNVPGIDQTLLKGGGNPSPVWVSDGSQPQSASPVFDQLKLIPGDRLASFFKANPSAIKDLVSASIPAGEIASWWLALNQQQRLGLSRTAPELVGNLEGIPYLDRDAANRKFLKQTIKRLESELNSGVGRGKNVRTSNQLQMLYQIRTAIGDASGESTRTLIELDVELPGKVVIAVGNLSTATYVSYLVPGMFFTVEGQVDDWADTAELLYNEQNKWLDRLGEADSTAATVAWIGYQTPHLLNVGSLELADEGAVSLSRSVEGLRTLRLGAEPFVTVIGHSYGSTAAMIALTEGSLSLNAFAMVGSPGSAAQSASELGMPAGEVFVGEAEWDPVINSAFYGSDPGSASFGARRFGVDGIVDPVTGVKLNPSAGHNEYFQPGSESIRNLALIGIGEGALAIAPGGG